jgi:hypothetical protein
LRIFGIGFHRTGTRSLNAFLGQLGFRGLHWPRSVDGRCYEALSIPHLRNRQAVLDVLKPLLDQYTAFSDVPFPALYRELHEHYRDSRFILMTRDLDRWWSSLVNHWHLEDCGFHALDPYEFLQYNRYTTTPLQYVTRDDQRLLTDIHAMHIQSVVEYFSGSAGVLAKVDLEDPDIARRLSAFLGTPCRAAFPYVA